MPLVPIEAAKPLGGSFKNMSLNVVEFVFGAGCLTVRARHALDV